MKTVALPECHPKGQNVIPETIRKRLNLNPGGAVRCRG